MTSTNHDIAGTDPASEALILQLIAQDFGQEIPQTLPEINSGSDHQEANSQRHNQGSDSQWNIQDPDDHWDIPGSDNEENQALEPSDNQSGLPAEQELRDSHSRYVSVDHNNTRAGTTTALQTSHFIHLPSELTRIITTALIQAKQPPPTLRITTLKRWRSVAEKPKIWSLAETRPVVVSLLMQTFIIQMIVTGLQVSGPGFLYACQLISNFCMLATPGTKALLEFCYANEMLINRQRQQQTRQSRQQCW